MTKVPFLLFVRRPHLAMSAIAAVLLALSALFAHNASAQAVAHAQNDDFTRSTDAHVTPFVGIGVEYFDYAENIPIPGGKSSHHAVLPTTRLGLDVDFPGGRWFSRFGVTYTDGAMPYDGSKMELRAGVPTVAPLTGDTHGFMIDGEGDMGFYPLQGGVRFGGYLGVGFRFWRRDMSGFPGGYLEDYHWWYVPIGALLDVPLARNFTLSIDGAIIPTFGGGLRARLSDIQPQLTDTFLELNTDIGYRLRIPVAFHATEALRIAFVPSLEYSAISESPATLLKTNTGATVTIGGQPAAVHEPASRTYRLAGMVTAGWTF